MEVYRYVKHKYMLEENIQKAYSLMLVQYTELLKIKLRKNKGCIKSSTKFDVFNIINIIKLIVFKSEDQKYLTLLLHQE